MREDELRVEQNDDCEWVASCKACGVMICAWNGMRGVAVAYARLFGKTHRCA